MAAALLERLRAAGAVQYGYFAEAPGGPAPCCLNLRFVPSYPDLLAALAEALVPLVEEQISAGGERGAIRLLPVPACVPLGTALSLALRVPLVYPAGEDPHRVEGAYDYNVPTLLLTDVLDAAAPLETFIHHVRRDGLHVEALVAVFSLGRCLEVHTPEGPIRPVWLFGPDALCNAAPTPLMRSAVTAWLGG